MKFLSILSQKNLHLLAPWAELMGSFDKAFIVLLLEESSEGSRVTRDHLATPVIYERVCDGTFLGKREWHQLIPDREGINKQKGSVHPRSEREVLWRLFTGTRPLKGSHTLTASPSPVNSISYIIVTDIFGRGGNLCFLCLVNSSHSSMQEH